MGFYKHPAWGGGRNYDIGLIHLLGKAESSGMRAKIYADATKRPWTYDLGPQETYVEGFGDGSTRGTAAAGCNPTAGQLRSGYMDATNRTTDITVQMDNIHCDGDSGGPWAYWLWSSAEQKYHYLQYAIHGGWVGVFNYSSVAAVLPPYRSWIESTINTRMAPIALSVSSRSLTTSSGVMHGYVSYAERPISGTLKNGNGWCLSSTSAAEGAPVVLSACNGSLAQTWLYFVDGTLYNYATSRYLDAQPTDQSLLRTYSFNNGPTQRFRYDRGILRVGADYSKCADVSWDAQYEGAPVWVWSCNGGAAQRFEF